MSKIEVTEEAVSKVNILLDRVFAFRKEMTLKEIRLLKKCQENPEDTNGILAGVLWIHRRRTKPDALFDDVLEMTESELSDALDKVLPQL